jgi:hypothetical protein
MLIGILHKVCPRYVHYFGGILRARMPERFHRRRCCPLCASEDARTLARLRAEEFCGANWTYVPQWREIVASGDETFPIVACGRCGFVYAELVPDDAFLELVYERVIDPAKCVEGSEKRDSYSRRLRYVAETIDLAPDAELVALDYGSGVGVTTRILASCGVRTIAFDPSASRVAYSGERNATIVSERDALRERGPFSIVILDNVLEHLPDPVEAVRFVASLCVRDAIVFASVPGYEPSRLQVELDAHERGAAIDMTFNPWEHLNYFSTATLDALMSMGGFQRVPAARQVSAPNIGLRAEASTSARVKNVAASAVRMLGYVARGEAVVSAEHAFYRYAG